jgi:hypothetical protein
MLFVSCGMSLLQWHDIFTKIGPEVEIKVGTASFKHIVNSLSIKVI